MSKAQPNLPANDPRMASKDSIPPYAANPTTGAERKPPDADPGRHTLLARSPIQQGRRSLFGR